MFGRFLSFLGFIPGLSGFSGMAGGYGMGGGGGANAEEGLEAEGEAAVSWTPGRPIASADAEETPDSRRGRITDRDLVWPGKVETIHIGNPEPIAYRFDLTVTDLPPAFHIRRPPLGGVPQREGGILLQPGEEASFEVVFVPPPAGERLKTRTFSFVLTYFDPRRSGDVGQIVQDLPLRWVALPTESDLQISAAPPVVVTRPWRREARFALQFANKSFLPSTVGMTILRAPTKEALGREPETAGTIQQALAARTPGVWQCLLPPPARRGSYFATVRGAAQAEESVSTPLALPRPVLVRYVPWLRLGRDWAFLFGSLLLLLWLVWGVPVRKTPTVRVRLAFAGLERGQLPADTQLKDLNAQMILLDGRGHDQEGQPPAPGVVIGDAFEFTGPTRWYGFRWPFGRNHWWNSWSREPQRFRVTVAPAEAEKGAFRRYDLNAIQPDGKPAYSAQDAESPFGPVVMLALWTAPAVHGVLVNLSLGHLGALAGRDLHKVSVRYTLDGQEQPPRAFELIHDTAGGLRPITLDLTDAVPLGLSRTFAVKVTADGLSSYDVQEVEVRRRDRPLPITLAFPNAYPKPAATPTTRPNPLKGEPSAPVPGGPPVKPDPLTPPPAAPNPAAPVLTSRNPPPTAPNPTAPNPTTPNPLTPHPKPTPPAPPPSNGPPPVPAGLVARAVSPTQINVYWQPVPGATRYVVYRSGGPGRNRPEMHFPADRTSFADAGLTPKTDYRYSILSKRGARSSKLSRRTLTPTPAPAPVRVTLTVSAAGRDAVATLEFVNVSKQNVYLNKISACADRKIGDDVFRVLADGLPVPFTGHKTRRPANPGERQFLTLAPDESVREAVTLSRSYRFPPGAHTYSATYSAPHNYRDQLQILTLTSDEARFSLSR